MGKRIRILILSVLCLLAMTGCAFMVGCSDEAGGRGGKEYDVTVAATAHGTVVADRAKSVVGGTVNLTVKPDSGYAISTLTVNDKSLTVKNNKASFKMPNENVTVRAVFLEEGVYPINIADAANAKVTTDKSTCKFGQTVTLTVTPNFGYIVTSLKMNGTDLTVTGGRAEFVMPEAIANITYETAMTDELTQAALGEYQYNLNSTVVMSTAKSYWTAVYGTDGMTVTVFVEDDRITANKDSVEMYFGKSGKANIHLDPDVNRGVKVYADGDFETYTATDTGYVIEDNNGVNVDKAEPWSKDGSKIDGYFIKVTVAYTALGFEAAPEDGAVTVLPIINNYTNMIGDTASFGGHGKANPGAYPVISDNKFNENYYAYGTGNLGGVSYLAAGKYWDLSKDYAADEDNYADRSVTLTAHDGIDNNLLFFRNQAESVYAEATFKLNSIWDGEHLGKFGLMLFDGANKKGVFFYVDANTAGDHSNDITKVKGSKLGYTTADGDYKWDGGEPSSTTGAFDYSKPITLKMAYDGESDFLFLWYEKDGKDVLVTRIKYKAQGDVTIGFKSFKMGITVTDYLCVNDKASEPFKSHIQELKDGDGAFGNGGSDLIYGSQWDISKDYAKDSENYADREIKLNGHDDNDNNIYFRETVGQSAYVRATFTVNEIFGEERWGKFGLMLFDGREKAGLFYYVDAYVGDEGEEEGKYDGIIRGRQLGYNNAPNDWGTWASTGSGDVFDLKTKTITLAMTYDNNVVTMFYEKPDGSDHLIMRVGYMPKYPENIVMGIKSFGYGLTVKNYTYTTDKTDPDFIEHNPEVEPQDIDVLFAGDRYMEFWKLYGVWNTLTYDMTEKGMELVNVGIGGTRIHEWNNADKINMLKMFYNPDKIVFHIGVNDIDSALSVDETYNRLVGMFTEYHKAFPTTTIYWISCIPNNFYIKPSGSDLKTTYNAEYKALNKKAEELIATLDYVEYIDMETPFTATDGGARSTYLHSTDGLHLNANYGYPLWTAVIKRAIGFELAGDDEKYSMGNTDTLAATPAWSYGTNGNIAEINRVKADHGKSVNNEESIYYKTAPQSDILFEAEIRSNGKYYADEFSKVGVTLVNEDITIFGYFETADAAPQDGAKVSYASLVLRPTFYNQDNDYNGRKTGIGDWNWDKQAGGAIEERNVKTTFSKIGIAKRGTKIHLLVDGKSVAQMDAIKMISQWNSAHNNYGFAEAQDLVVTAASKFTPGVMTFNRNVEIKTVRAVTDTALIDRELAPSYTLSVPAYDATVIEVEGNKTTAKAGDSISFTVTADDIEKVFVTYGGEDHELTLADGKYTFTMPEANVAIKVTFGNRLTVTLGEGVAEKLTVSSMSVVSGSTVTFTAKANVYIAKLMANGTEITTKDEQGNYTLVVTEEVDITGEFFAMYDGIVLDGVRDDEYGTVSTEVPLEDNRNMQVWAKKTAGGVLIYAMSHSNELKNDGGNWFENSNFEFYLNDGGQRFINIKGAKQGVTDYFQSHKQITDASSAFNGKYENIYEIFVAKSDIPDFDKGNIQLNYAFKTGNGIDKVGYITDYIWRDAATKSEHNGSGDWWGLHAIGGAESIREVEYNRVGRPRNLYISENGLVIVKAKAPESAVVDGDLNEYADKFFVTAGVAEKATFTVSGFRGADGLYMTMTIIHGNWSPEKPGGDWSTNDNIEFNIAGKGGIAVIFRNGQLMLPAIFPYGKAKTVTENGKQKTTLEIFMPSTELPENVEVKIGCNGEGFGGWQSLFWDNNNVYFTDRGVMRKLAYKVTIPAYSDTEIALDGGKTEVKPGDSVSFTVTANAIDKVFVTYGGEDHELTLTDGKYTFTMPAEDVTLKVTFNNRAAITVAENIIDKVTASDNAVVIGSTVTSTAQDGFYIKKLSANGTEIVKTGDRYELTVGEDVTITGEVVKYQQGMIFDGELTAEEGWTQERLDNGAFFNAKGSALTLYGFNTAEGVRIAAIIKHSTHSTQLMQQRDEGAAWHRYLGLELRLNGQDGEAYAIQTSTWGIAETGEGTGIWIGESKNYLKNCKPVWRTVANTGDDKLTFPWVTVCELIVDHSVCETSADSPVSIAGGGVFEHGFYWLGGDNSSTLRFTHNIGANGLTAVSDEYKTFYETTDAVLDGVFDEAVWTDEVKTNTYSQIVNGAKVSVMGVKAQTGVLLGVTVDHSVAPGEKCQGKENLKTAEWFHFMGPEFRLNGLDKQICANVFGYAQFSNNGVKTVKNGEIYTTSFEVYVPYSVTGTDGSVDIPLAISGVFETGYQTLFGSSWGGNPFTANSPFKVTANGLKRVLPTAENVVLDGKMDDSVWTETVLSAEHTVEYEITSGKAAVNAVKLTDGVLIGIRITSSQSAFTSNGADNRFNWEHYQNIRLNLFATPHHVYAYAPSIDGINNGDDNVVNTGFGSHEVKNTDGTYTTTYEIYVPKAAYADQDFSANIALTCIVHTTQADAGTFNVLGGTEQSGADVNWFGVCGYITDDGMIGLSA